MIFSPQLARLVLSGRKTMTRRPVREPRFVTRRNGTTYTTRPFRPVVGKSVAVQPGRGRPAAEARIVITDVRKEFAGAITFADARAEGFRTTDEYRAYWLGLYDRGWVEQTDRLLANLAASEEQLAQDLDLTGPVVRRRLRFLQRAQAVTRGDDGLWLREEHAEHLAEQARFNARHAGTLVWVIRFELDRSHVPRFLAPASRGERDGDELGYTSDPALALPGEPEAVDQATVLEFAADARDRMLGQPGRREEMLRRRARSLANRLRQGSIAAARAGVDDVELAAQLDQIEQHLAELERLREAA